MFKKNVNNVRVGLFLFFLLLLPRRLADSLRGRAGNLSRGSVLKCYSSYRLAGGKENKILIMT